MLGRHSGLPHCIDWFSNHNLKSNNLIIINLKENLNENYS